MKLVGKNGTALQCDDWSMMIELLESFFHLGDTDCHLMFKKFRSDFSSAEAALLFNKLFRASQSGEIFGYLQAFDQELEWWKCFYTGDGEARGVFDVAEADYEPCWPVTMRVKRSWQDFMNFLEFCDGFSVLVEEKEGMGWRWRELSAL